MKEYLENVLREYNVAYGESFKDHPMGTLFRQTLPASINEIILEKERYKVIGSSGHGNWSATPWIAIFDILITNTAQSGYYPVFLFRQDMSGFYLSLNQGVTEIRKKYNSKDTNKVLKIKAEDFRAQIDIDRSTFNTNEIDLRISKKNSLARFYESGNIVSKYYSSFNVPDMNQLRQDLIEVLKLYEIISYNEGLPTSQAGKEDGEDAYVGFEDLRKFRFHKRIERNIQLSKEVKKAQGYTCKACGLNFEEKYGEIGKEYIEAHHLTPLSKLGSGKVELNVKTDFVVLCSNCHSMIHRLRDASNLNEFKQHIKVIPPLKSV